MDLSCLGVSSPSGIDTHGGPISTCRTAAREPRHVGGCVRQERSHASWDHLRVRQDSSPKLLAELRGVAQSTPWDEELAVEMVATDVAVHEEALLPVLLGDLRAP
ncbi:DUF2399 domain-containing protein [Nakamurella alba]|nr:DUF2399 domain-containing protein [Nakamurella alba]